MIRRTILKRVILAWILASLVGIGSDQTVRSQSPGSASASRPTELQSSHSASRSVAEFREVVNTYCLGCHNERVRAAGLLLDQADVLISEMVREFFGVMTNDHDEVIGSRCANI